MRAASFRVAHAARAALLVATLAAAACETVPPKPSAEPAAAAPAAPVQLWTCGMHPQVIRSEPGACPICGMALTPLAAQGVVQSVAGREERKVRYWWDPMMSPPYISDRPGKSPMGMDLVPVYEDETPSGPAVVIDPVMVQNMGVRVAPVTRGPLRGIVRAAGYFAEAEPHQHDVNLRVSGWIERLYADTEGMHVNAGTPLFDLYSPELQVAVDELRAARRAQDAGTHDPETPTAAQALYAAAERKLLLFGVERAEVTRLAQLDRPPTTVRFYSPVTGHVVDKPVVDGSAVKAGDRVLRIVDHGLLWLDVQIYERQLPFVHLGQAATATAVGIPGRRFDGEVSFMHPHVEAMTRTAMVRVAVRNETLALRPGMYATVELTAELSPSTLLVPREAVIDTGTRQVVFVTLAHGHFDPREVTMGAAGADGQVQILSGLREGDLVVTSGQFLLDAESHFRAAIQKFLRTDLLIPSEEPRGDTPREALHDQHGH
jgi:Cu(I)/Ag(I) efflux system membrane fusion protein